MSSAQEFNDLPWGTPMPVMLRIGAGVVSVVARGSYSVAVSDEGRFRERVGDVDGLRSQARPILASKLADALGSIAASKASMAELAASSAEIAAAVKSQAEQGFNALGLTVTQVKIEAIEERG